MRESKREIVQDIAKYSGSQILARGLGVVRGFVVARLLGPSFYGFWNALELVLVYGTQSTLGIFDALAREIPINRGKNDSEKIAIIQDVAFGFIFSLPLLVVFLIFGISFLYSGSPEVTFGLKIFAPTLMFLIIYSYFIFIFRSHNQFGVVSKLVVVHAVILTVVVIGLVKGFGIYGMIIAQLITFVAMAIIAKYYCRLKIRARFDYAEVIRLIKIGFPIMLIGLTAILFGTVDRMMIIAFLEQTQLGYYAIGLVVLGFLRLVSGSIAETIYPKMGYAFGETESREGLQSYVIQPQILMSLIASILVGASYFIYPFFITLLLPDYVPGIAAVRILILGSFVAGLPDTSKALFIINKQNVMLIIRVFAILLNAILNYTLIKLNMGIVGVALATVIAYGSHFLVVNWVGLHYLNMPIKSIGVFLAKILSPFAYVLLLLFLISKGVSLLDYGLIDSNIYFRVALELFLFVCGIVPLVIILWRRIKKLGIDEALRTWRQPK